MYAMALSSPKNTDGYYGGERSFSSWVKLLISVLVPVDTLTSGHILSTHNDFSEVEKRKCEVGWKSGERVYFFWKSRGKSKD